MYESKPHFFSIKLSVPEEREKTIDDIQRFIEQKHWHFSSEELRKEILRFIPVGAALKDWIKTIEHPETKRKYRRAIQKLFFDAEIPAKIEPNFSIECLDENNCIGMYSHILEFFDASESTKTLCITAYARFCDFIRIKTYGIIDPEVNLREQISFRKAEEIYNHVDWNQFLDAVEMPYQLIAKLIYLSAKHWKYRLRVSGHNKNMLSMTTKQINFNGNTISFHEDQSYHVSGLIAQFPDSFMQELKKLVEGRKGIVFESSTEKKILPNQVERALVKASKKLGLSSYITPVILSWIGVIACEEEFQE